MIKLRGPSVCWSGGSVLSGTGGPNRLVWMARINKWMSRTRNHIAPHRSTWAWLHKACRCRSGPLGPSDHSYNCERTHCFCKLSTTCLGLWRPIWYQMLELASWKLLQPECHYLQHGAVFFLLLLYTLNLTSKCMHSGIRFILTSTRLCTKTRSANSYIFFKKSKSIFVL